jgi:hypothetical protein
MASPEDQWKLQPGAEGEIVFPSEQQLYRAAERAERSYWSTWRVSPSILKRFKFGDGCRFFWKHPATTFGFGIPGLLLIAANFPLAAWLGGSDFERAGGLGLARLGLILGGALLLFIAAPLYKPMDWTWDKQREEDGAHEYFRSKRGI